MIRGPLREPPLLPALGEGVRGEGRGGGGRYI